MSTVFLTVGIVAVIGLAAWVTILALFGRPGEPLPYPDQPQVKPMARKQSVPPTLPNTNILRNG